MVGVEGPIVVQIDQGALEAQITEAVSVANRKVSFQLRQAADMLDPEFMTNHNRWVEEEAIRKYEESHREQNVPQRKEEV